MEQATQRQGVAVSDMYGFGEEQGIEPQTQEPDPRGFRKWMGEVSETLKELRAENERLRTEQAKSAVRDAATAQGYAPQVADLYTGKPEGFSEWLSANGALFVKSGTAAEGEQQAQTQQGPPATTVSPESQAAAAAFAAAGQGGSANGLSAEQQLEARLNQAQTKQEFDAIMRETGNVRYR